MLLIPKIQASAAGVGGGEAEEEEEEETEVTLKIVLLPAACSSYITALTFMSFQTENSVL